MEKILFFIVEAHTLRLNLKEKPCWGQAYTNIQKTI